MRKGKKRPPWAPKELKKRHMRPFKKRTPKKYKKLFIAGLILLIYFFLYFVPWSYSVRFLAGLFLPFVVLIVFVLFKIFLRPYSLLKRVSLSILISVILVYIPFCLLVFTNLLPLSYTILVGDTEIQNTVIEITSGISDPELKVREIINWEKKNIEGMYGDKPDFGRFYFISEFPFTWIRNSHDPSWIFFYKRGMCTEYAVLFVKMAEFAGIQSRRVYNLAEDHVWAEAWIDNSWKHVDPSENKFDNPGFYENERGKQLSYVYTFDNEGNEIDITNRYTRTGKLIVYIMKDNAPAENAKVVVKSRFLMEINPEKYKTPRKAKVGFTDQNGTCVFNLGGNNYTIVAESDSYRDEQITNLREDGETYITIILD